MEKPPSPYAQKALGKLQIVFRGKPLPEGIQLLRTLRSYRFPDGHRLNTDEIRWVAQQLIQSRVPGFLSTLWRTITRPEEAAPEADLTQPARDIGPVEGLGNILRTPQRALIASLIPKGKTYGKEAGKPSTTQSFAEAYASDPTWGSFLEAILPQVPKPIRQAVGIAGDIAIDPLALLGIISKGTMGSKILRQSLRAGRTMAESTNPVVRKVGGLLNKELPRLQFLDWSATTNLSRWLGIDTSSFVNRGNPLRLLGLGLHFLLDPSVTKVAVLDALATGGKKSLDDFLFLALGNLNTARMARKALAEYGFQVGRAEDIIPLLVEARREIPPEVLRAAEEVAEKLPEYHPIRMAVQRVKQRMKDGRTSAPGGDVLLTYAVAGLKLEDGGIRLKPPRDVDPTDILSVYHRLIHPETQRLLQNPTPTVAAEVARWIDIASRNPSVADKVLSAWKASKTILNPPSVIRNFWQNFLLRYAEGVEGADPISISKAIVRLAQNPERFKQLWKLTAVGEGRAAETASGLGNILTKAGRIYEGADRLAAVILSEATGRSPAAFMMNYGMIPQSLDFLRRSGLAPFISWYYFAVPAMARGLVNQPHRSRQVLQALNASQPSPEKRGEYVQIGNREINVGNMLPINPADFGGEMRLFDPRNIPAYTALQALGQLFFPRRGEAQGYKPIGGTERLKGWEGLAAFLKDFFGPPAASIYIPGLISPPEPQPGKRQPRQRIDYLLGLLGAPTRPVDPEADLRAEMWKRIDENRRKAEELRDYVRREFGE